MAAEMRFDCKFCNNSIYAPYSLGGKKVKCPHCKNPVVVPVQEIKEEPQKVQEVKQVKRKDPERRPIHARPKWSFGGIVKLAVLVAVAFAGYKGWIWYKDSQKDVKTLLQEYSNGQRDREQMILLSKKMGEGDVESCKLYFRSDDMETRKLVAKVLGKIGSKKGFEMLEKLLADKEKEVREAAAAALGSIKTQKSAACLVHRLERENLEDVVIAITKSLYAIGETCPDLETRTDTETLKSKWTQKESWINTWWSRHQNKAFEHDKN